MKQNILISCTLQVLFWGLVSAKDSIKGVNSTDKTAAENQAELKKWQASAEGKKYAEWQQSAAGKKVYANEEKIKKAISTFSKMEAEIIALSLPTDAKLGNGMRVQINGAEYLLRFMSSSLAEIKQTAEQVKGLKVHDQIVIKSRNVSHAPKYAYPIITCDYLEHAGKIIYKRVMLKGTC
jgi:invasion protein IalB